jgi:hypothetical protein
MGLTGITVSVSSRASARDPLQVGRALPFGGGIPRRLRGAG